MSSSKRSSRKRASPAADSVLGKQQSKLRVDEDFDPDLSSDIQGLMSAFNQIREKAQRDGQKRNEETISSVAAEVRSMIGELKSKIDKDRQGLAKAIAKSSKECETCLRNETAKFQEMYDKFNKEKAAHMQALKDSISKFEEDRDKLVMRFEQMRKKEKSMISEHEKACNDKIAKLEEFLKKKKQDDKTFSILRKTLGSFLGNASDEDFPPDD